MPEGPPPPPAVDEESAQTSGSMAPIADLREKFQRTEPATDQDREQAAAFIQGKIEMIRGDPRRTDEEKKAAIAQLEGGPR